MPGMSGVPTSVGLAGMMAGGSQAGMVGMQSLQGQQEALRQMQMAQMQVCFPAQGMAVLGTPDSYMCLCAILVMALA